MTNLDRCAGQKNSPFSFETHERLVGLVFGIFESVTFIAKDKSDLTLMQDRGVQTERFVRQNLEMKVGLLVLNQTQP